MPLNDTTSITIFACQFAVGVLLNEKLFLENFIRIIRSPRYRVPSFLELTPIFFYAHVKKNKTCVLRGEDSMRKGFIQSMCELYLDVNMVFLFL